MTLKEIGYVGSLIITYKKMEELYDNWEYESTKQTAEFLSRVYTICIKDLEELMKLEENSDVN